MISNLWANIIIQIRWLHKNPENIELDLFDR